MSAEDIGEAPAIATGWRNGVCRARPSMVARQGSLIMDAGMPERPDAIAHTAVQQGVAQIRPLPALCRHQVALACQLRLIQASQYPTEPVV